MNVTALLEDLDRQDVHVKVHGERLHVDGPGAVLTDELCATLKVHKPAIISALTQPETQAEATGVTLEDIAQDHGLAAAELEQAAGPDWADIKDNPAILEALANAIQTRRMREQGIVPPHYTEVVECAGCGPVYLWPGGQVRVHRTGAYKVARGASTASPACPCRG